MRGLARGFEGCANTASRVYPECISLNIYIIILFLDSYWFIGYYLLFFWWLYLRSSCEK